jgi:hypothetical protein
LDREGSGAASAASAALVELARSGLDSFLRAGASDGRWLRSVAGAARLALLAEALAVGGSAESIIAANGDARSPLPLPDAR